MVSKMPSTENNPMENRDPFVVGLTAILAERRDLTPAGLATDAGLDNSTIRKLISGEIKSMTIEKAHRIARALGIDLSTIIALGEHSHGPEIVRLALAIQAADDAERDRIDGYLRIAAQSQTS